MQKYNFLQHNPNNSKRKFKKKQLFYSTNGKINQKNDFTYLYYIGTKEKEYPQHKIYKKYKLQTNSFLFLSIQKPPKHRQSCLHSAKTMQLGLKSNAFTTQKHCNYTAKRILLPNT